MIGSSMPLLEKLIFEACDRQKSNLRPRLLTQYKISFYKRWVVVQSCLNLQPKVTGNQPTNLIPNCRQQHVEGGKDPLIKGRSYKEIES